MRNYISFDLETFYGVWDTKGYEYCLNNCSISFEATKRINQIHKKYKLHYTVGIVGFMLRNEMVSHFFEGRNSKTEVFYKCYQSLKLQRKIPSDLLFEIKNSEFCEIISHTYTHNYFNNVIQEKFRVLEYKEIENDINIYGLKRGIIFPKNQANKETIKFFTEKNFVVRTNFNNLLYKTRHYNFLVRVLRYLDSYLPITELFNVFHKPENSKSIIEGGIFFRPSLKFKIFDRIHQARIIFHYQYCKVTNRSFHLWSHPHNFYPLENSLMNYDRLLNKLIKKGLITSHFTKE